MCHAAFDPCQGVGSVAVRGWPIHMKEAKPARGQLRVSASSDVWDLGVRVAIYGDSALQGGNVPVALQAFIKNYEARAPNSMASGGPMAGLGSPEGGLGVIGAGAFLKHHGLRDWMIEHRAML